jgi:hypothetical protein
MGIIGELYFDYSGDVAKKVHRKYNAARHKIDGTKTGDVLNHFGFETDPFSEER